MLKLDRIDHFVLTVASIEASCAFYTAVLGMKEIEFSHGRKALTFGQHKINLHQAGAEFSPCARHPRSGSGDFCLLAEGKMETIIAHFAAMGVALESGPVDRSGAMGPLRSVYLRDPDGNLVEIAVRAVE